MCIAEHKVMRLVLLIHVHYVYQRVCQGVNLHVNLSSYLQPNDTTNAIMYVHIIVQSIMVLCSAHPTSPIPLHA
jgi:hypothetical protein